MQTIKTGVVVVLLIAVCYGAFVALNAPEADIPEELQQWANSENIEGLMEIEMPSAGGFSFDSGAAIVPPNELLVATQPNATHEMNALPVLPALPSVGSPAQPFESSPLPEFSSSEIAGNPPGSGPSGVAPSDVSAARNSSSLVGSLPQATNPLAVPLLGATDLDGPTVPLDATLSQSAAQVPSDLISTVLSNEPATDYPSQPNDPNAGLPNATNTSASPTQKSLPSMPFEIAREQALMKASGGSLREALQQLSAYYESPELGHATHEDLVDILDALSREVIYSARHLIEAAYIVETNDTLESVAQRYQISPELLAAINRMGDSKALIVGSNLKVLEGPFRSEVSLTRGELTLFLGELYAGRFPISIARSNPPTEGAFEVVDRRRDRPYYGPNGLLVKADVAENPYGGYWLSLGNNLSIHGSPEMARSDLEGCISLAPLDAADVYAILTKHSQVTIRN